MKYAIIGAVTIIGVEALPSLLICFGWEYQSEMNIGALAKWFKSKSNKRSYFCRRT